jgi:hypothetical protein
MVLNRLNIVAPVLDMFRVESAKSAALSGRNNGGSIMLRALLVLATATSWVTSAAALDADVVIGVLACTVSDPKDGPEEAAAGERARDALCTFQPKMGTEETYVGKMVGISITSDQDRTVMWVVRSPVGSNAAAGALQQVYSSGSIKPADQSPPLIGETNAELALHSMEDKPEGSVSASKKPAPTGFVILRLELTLKASAA